MTCAGCARTVERQLASSPGVEKASVNFATKVASVSFNPAQTRVEDLVAAVEQVATKFRSSHRKSPKRPKLRELHHRLVFGAVFAIPC